MTETSRHIPKATQRLLLEEARGRCCICRELVLAGSDRHFDVEAVLEKHHIVPFAEGGGHEPENLIVIHPTCHRLVHKQRANDQEEFLRAAKQRWKAMAEIVPSRVLYDGPGPAHRDERLCLLALPFGFETYGLVFEVIAPDTLTAAEFAAFLKQNIVNPVAAWDGNQEMVESTSYLLAPSGESAKPFRSESLLRDLPCEEGTHLNLHVHIHVVARAEASGVFTLETTPAAPRSGQDYLVELRHSQRKDFTADLEIRGTDDFRLSENIRSKDGLISQRVSGAGSGIEDSILARGEFGTMRLTIVFGATEGSKGTEGG